MIYLVKGVRKIVEDGRCSAAIVVVDDGPASSGDIVVGVEGGQYFLHKPIYLGRQLR